MILRPIWISCLQREAGNDQAVIIWCPSKQTFPTHSWWWRPDPIIKVVNVVFRRRAWGFGKTCLVILSCISISDSQTAQPVPQHSHLPGNKQRTYKLLTDGFIRHRELMCHDDSSLYALTTLCKSWRRTHQPDRLGKKLSDRRSRTDLSVLLVRAPSCMLAAAPKTISWKITMYLLLLKQRCLCYRLSCSEDLHPLKM